MCLGWDSDHLKTVWSFHQKTLFPVTYLFCWASAFAERFFCAGSVPQADLQTFKVSVTAVKSVQHKRTGEKPSCVSHMKQNLGLLRGEARGLLDFGVRTEFCRLGLEVPSAGFCCSTRENTPELQEFMCPWNCLTSCVLGTVWAPQKILPTPPNVLLLLPPGPRLAPLKFWASPKTRSPILRIYH